MATNINLNLNASGVVLDDTNLIVSKEIELQAYADSNDAAVLRARGTGVSSDYTFSASIGGTTFTVGTVTGEVNSDQGYFDGTYAGAGGVTVDDLNAPSTYVYLDNAFTLQQQISTPTEQDWNRKIFLARISVDTSTNLILGKEFLCNPVGHYGNTIRTLWRYIVASGVPFKIGMEVTGHPADLGFDIAAGTLMEYGGTGNINCPHELEFSLLEDVTFTTVYRTTVGADATDLPKVWDNGGVITALGSTTCAAHRIYRFSNGQVALAPGQENYANMVLCKAGAKLEEFVLNPRLKNAEFLGWWLIEETATGTSGTVDAEFVEYVIGIQGASSSGLAGAVLRSNNGSDFSDLPQTRINLGVDKTNKAVPTGTYTIVAGDLDKFLVVTAPCVVTLPNGFAANLEFQGIQTGAGDVSFVAQSGGALTFSSAFQNETEGADCFFGIRTFGSDSASLTGTLKLV
jgi:hypothetical protein